MADYLRAEKDEQGTREHSWHTTPLTKSTALKKGKKWRCKEGQEQKPGTVFRDDILLAFRQTRRVRTGSRSAPNRASCRTWGQEQLFKTGHVCERSWRCVLTEDGARRKEGSKKNTEWKEDRE